MWYHASYIAAYCLLQKEETPMLGGSKKDGKLRRSEILGTGDNSLAHHLCQLCANHAADMLQDPLACDVVIEVAQAGADGMWLCNTISADFCSGNIPLAHGQQQLAVA